jgi:two-component system chemotaxis response regulator CheB
MPVTFAFDRQPIRPDTVYVAVPDRHLMIERDCIRVTRGPKESRARPAIDVLFRSAALTFGPRVIGVVLSGSLDDGTAGLWQIKEGKGLALVQDPEEAQHRSMPDSAIEHVDVDFVGTVHALAAEITRLVATRLSGLPEPLSRPGQHVENAIALGESGMHTSVMDLGKASKYTCPKCGGVLAQIEEGRVVRFRCHTGHAYSFKSLLADVSGTVDASLWSTIRAIEERILILQHLAALAEKTGRHDDAERLQVQADQAEKKCQPLRELVLDADFLASD